jgi:hypothetical protein
MKKKWKKIYNKNPKKRKKKQKKIKLNSSYYRRRGGIRTLIRVSLGMSTLGRWRLGRRSKLRWP